MRSEVPVIPWNVMTQAPVTISGFPVVALLQESPPGPFTRCEVDAAALSRRTTHTLQHHNPERGSSEVPDSPSSCVRHKALKREE